MKNLKLKKGLLLIGSSFVIVSTFHPDHKYTPKYEIVNDEESDAFATIDDQTLYIYSSKKELESHRDEVKENDILVVDERFTVDPNMIIYDSYLICDKDTRNDILSCLLEYESMYPSPWDRTIESMRNEWLIHNLSYYLHYRRGNAAHVDLNNVDESKYDSTILKKILFN